MKTLLRIDSSVRIKGSYTRALADHFEEHWLTLNPNGKIIYRDLAKTQIPHITNKTVEGFYTPKEYITNELLESTALSDLLIEELKEADDVLLSSPLYNFNIPSSLKAYFDHVVRIGHSFKTSDQGYEGLLNEKSAYIITAKGGKYKGTSLEQLEFQDHYLKTILSFIGINVQHTYTLEEVAIDLAREENIKTIQKQINRLK